jgi:hypothetical protein
MQEEKNMTVWLDLRRHLASNAATSVAFITVLVVCLGGRGAYAQSEVFDASNRLEPRAGTLILLGECREQSHQLASAWSAYKAALVRVKNQHYREFAQAKAVALEPRLSYLVVIVSDDSKIRGLTIMRNGEPFDSILWNRALPVDGGDYVITGRAPEHEEWQFTVHVPVEGAKMSVEVPKLKELSKPISQPAAPVSRVYDVAGRQEISAAIANDVVAPIGPAAPVGPAAPTAVDAPPPRRIPLSVYVSWGATGALALTTGVLALVARSANNDLANLRGSFGVIPAQLVAQRDSVHRDAVLTDLALGATLASAGVATYLTLTRMEHGAPPERARTVQVHVGLGGISLTGRF